ncbi:MAG: RNA polymerase subunit sigma-70 [Ignavibacteriae bacterium]|nr:MAG: RNA polymerase subunit sigma-70 [Ignavibacteriota bacterium]
MDQEEVRLIEKFLDGSDVAFNKLIKSYQKNIYWHARRMVGNHLDADEITQQVIIVLYKKLKTFKFNSSLKTWIYKIVSTRSLNMIKRRKIKKFFSLNSKDAKELRTTTDIIKNFEDKEKINQLNKKLSKIPVKQREVFVLRHFDELSYEEISEITAKSIGGLKANYFHASKKILGIMDNEK